MQTPWDSENKWAVYPIEKIEAAVRALNEAIVLARQARNEADMRKQQERSEQAKREISERDLNKIICRGCHDHLSRCGEIEPFHTWIDGCTIEPCTATPERKKELRQYFAKELLTDLQKAGV